MGVQLRAGPFDRRSIGSGVNPAPLARYDRAAVRSAAVVIAEYSTSFGLAVRLLPAATRKHIRDVYALVRLADEVVDGVAAAAGVPPERIEIKLHRAPRAVADHVSRGLLEGSAQVGDVLRAKRLALYRLVPERGLQPCKREMRL